MGYGQTANTHNVFVMKSGVSAPSASLDRQIWDANLSTYIQDGAIVITTPEGKVLDTTATGVTKFVIKQRVGDTLYSTGEIDVDSVKQYIGTRHKPHLEKVVTIGFNGTTGSGTFTTNLLAGQEYILTAYREEDDYMGVDRPKSAIYIQGTNPTLVSTFSSSTVGEGEIVFGLADFVYKEFIKTVTGYTTVDLPVKPEVLAEGTNGSASTTNVVSYRNDVVTKTSHGFTVGTVLRIGGSAATYPVYFVQEVIDANTYRLSVPYQGASGSVSVYPVTTITSWGLKLTGLVRPFSTGLRSYQKTRFSIQKNNIYITGNICTYGINESTAIDTIGLTTTTTNVVAANTLIANIDAFSGRGKAEQAKEEEWYYLGIQGEEKQYRLSVDREKTNRQLVADANGTSCTYSVLTLGWTKLYDKNPISTFNDSGTITIFIPVTYNTTTAVITETVATAATYGFVNVLDTILPSTLADQATAIV